ncbi:hypothetical protein NCCP2165_27280 [Halomonas sp. NCCP-2165]|nr:hypothetical protein NCCP2165_27280 [Halomonas sp. NCCP-2165]
MPCSSQVVPVTSRAMPESQASRRMRRLRRSMRNKSVSLATACMVHEFTKIASRAGEIHIDFVESDLEVRQS